MLPQMKVSCEEVHGAEGVVRCQDEEYIERGGGGLEVAFGARYLTYTLTCNGVSFFVSLSLFLHRAFDRG